MSVKEPWDSSWKTNCRIKSNGCDGMSALVSKNTMNADGARWEVQCATEEGVPVLGMYTQSESKGAQIPPEIWSLRVIEWSWPPLDAHP